MMMSEGQRHGSKNKQVHGDGVRHRDQDEASSSMTERFEWTERHLDKTGSTLKKSPDGEDELC